MNEWYDKQVQDGYAVWIMTAGGAKTLRLTPKGRKKYRIPIEKRKTARRIRIVKAKK